MINRYILAFSKINIKKSFQFYFDHPVFRQELLRVFGLTRYFETSQVSNSLTNSTNQSLQLRNLK